MKKFTALLLALMMVVSLFAACGDDTGNDVLLNDESDDTGTETAKDSADDTDEADVTTEYEYEPDPEGLYSGMVGIGSNGASAMFKSLTVTDMNKNKETWNAELDELEDPLADWSYATVLDGAWDSTSGGVSVTSWSDSASEDETEAEDDSYKVISVDGGNTGVMAYTGNSLWNYVQFKFQIYITELEGGMVFYFCVTDENNYYACVADEDSITVYQVSNGVSTTLDSVIYTVPTGEWFWCSATVYTTHIRIYIGGTMLFDLFAEVSDPYYGSVGIGQWSTANTFDNLVVTSNETGEVIYENDFSDASTISDFTFLNGYGGNWDTEVTDDDGSTHTIADVWQEYWVIEDDEDDEHGGVLSCTNSSYYGGCLVVTEGIANANWTNYTLDVDVRRNSGSECWLVVFNYITENDYAWFNIGGWSNSSTTFKYVVNGSGTNLDLVSDTYETDVWYHVTIIVKPDLILGYVDGELILTMTYSF